LAAFWEAGLFWPRYGVRTCSPAPVWPLPASTINPAAARRRTMTQILAAVRSQAPPGQGPETHTISPCRLAMTCRFIPRLRLGWA